MRVLRAGAVELRLRLACIDLQFVTAEKVRRQRLQRLLQDLLLRSPGRRRQLHGLHLPILVVPVSLAAISAVLRRGLQ